LKIFDSIAAFRSTRKTVITIGTFDGVHIGHRKIIDRVVSDAVANGLESVILTFFPHPRIVLHGGDGIKLLNTLDEKKTLLEAAGLQNLIVHPFDEAFANLTAREFVQTVLVDKLNIAKIVIGHDHRFGKNRDAGIEDLIVFGREFSFEVEQIPAQEINAVSVSSTKIRKALSDGEMELANNYLGYNYFITGTVVNGRQLGRTIGFPTANIKIAESYKLIPKNGIYIAQSVIDGKNVRGMLSIGTNPTVGGQELSIEMYYMDFDGDLYGKTLSVEILSFIRDEQKFDSMEALKAAIANDRVIANAYFDRQ